ncbi:MAG: signal peptidase II, partial [Terrimesophilobacter sp.]
IVDRMQEGEQVAILGPILQFHFVKNSGAAFSFASGSTWIFSIVAAGVTVFILWYARRIRSVAWAVLFGMLLGGTTGNLTDRLFREPGFGVGHVVDFIQVWGFPAIFNIADSFIVASMGLFIILSLRGTRLDGRRIARNTGA